MKKPIRFSIVLICVIIVLALSTTALLLNADAFTGDPYLYCLDGNAVSPALSRMNPPTHCDHEGSENCRYSCILESNTYVSSGGIRMTEKEAKHFVSDYKAICSIPDAAIRDEKLAAFISFYYGIPLNKVDLAGMRQAAESLRRK